MFNCKRLKVLKIIAAFIGTAMVLSGSICIGAQSYKGNYEYDRTNKVTLKGDFWINNYSADETTAFANVAVLTSGDETAKAYVRVSASGWSDNKWTGYFPKSDIEIFRYSPNIYSNARYADSLNLSVTLENTDRSPDYVLQQDNYWKAL